MNLKCEKCKEQPPYFNEIIKFEVNDVDLHGNYISDTDGARRYECSACGNEATDLES